MRWPWWAAPLAAVPLVVLTALVLRGVAVMRAAWSAAATTVFLAMVLFGLSTGEITTATVRGTWTGAWILLIVLPALLLYEVLDRSGALDQLADAADMLAPTEGRRLLLLAWVLPSFLQGAAGYGAPIAMAAPLLVRRGMPPVAAVAACLIGYQWSVTFGSMGSSFFVAAATARLSAEATATFAFRTGLVLAVSALLSGWLVLRRAQRSSGDTWRMLVIGGVMATTLVIVVVVQPALGSTTAGLAGLAACWWLLPARGSVRPDRRRILAAAVPYVALTATAVVGFAFPPVRRLFERIPEIAPVVAGSDAAFGFSTAAGPLTPVFRPLLHPMPYVVTAVVVALIMYRKWGWWQPTMGRAALTSWLRRSRGVALSIVGMTVLAALMTEAGMIAALAEAAARTLDVGFLAASAPLGALGTVLTGSTTSSNALFSSLQAEVATLLAIVPAIMLVGQTAGGNVGNALSPGVAMVGAAAAGAPASVGEIVRRNLAGSALLVLTVSTMLVLQVLWLS